MSSNGLIFQYGSYKHPVGEVYPRAIEIRPHFSSRGVRWASTFRMNVAGSFNDMNPELDTDGVHQRMVAMAAAYANDYQDAGFRIDDGKGDDGTGSGHGTQTKHWLNTDDTNNLSGNQVIHRSWDNVLPSEFANTRSFGITVQAKYRDSYSDILYFSERVQKIGTGGPVWRLYNEWDNASATFEDRREYIFNQSKVYHIQRGTVVGSIAYPVIPGPLWPAEEQEWKRIIINESPRHHGHLSFSKPTHYTTQYAYFFERIGADATLPNPWNP